MELTVTGCLKIEAVCLMGGTKFASFLKLLVKSYCLLLLAAWPFDFDFAPPPLEEDFPFVVAKAEIQTNLVFCYKKLFWPTVRKNCSTDRKKLLKFKAEGWEFTKILRSLEQFVRTVNGQNNLW